MAKPWQNEVDHHLDLHGRIQTATEMTFQINLPVSYSMHACTLQKQMFILAAKYLVTRIAWLSLLCNFMNVVMEKNSIWYFTRLSQKCFTTNWFIQLPWHHGKDSWWWIPIMSRQSIGSTLVQLTYRGGCWYYPVNWWQHKVFELVPSRDNQP